MSRKIQQFHFLPEFKEPAESFKMAHIIFPLLLIQGCFLALALRDLGPDP
jgi:hypothetical protein